MQATIKKVGTAYFAKLNGSAEYYIGQETTYQATKGLGFAGSKYYGPVFDPAPHFNRFGAWVYLLGGICQGESRGYMNLVNSYDRAAFTYGFFQLGAHTPNDNFVLYVRRMISDPTFKSLFPDLLLVNGRVHSMSPAVQVDLEKPSTDGKTIPLFMAYFNPNSLAVDPQELQTTAKMVYLANTSSAARFGQIATGVDITQSKFKQRFQPWYNLDGRSDTICLIVADIHHQGRASKEMVKAALDSSSPIDELLKIGAETFPKRIQTLRDTIAAYGAKGWLGSRRYDAASNSFI